MHKRLTFIVALSVTLMICSTVVAAETETEGDWRFNLAPMYLWGVMIDGTQTVKGQDMDLDADFSDIWNNLNGVFTVHLDVDWKQKWGGFIDVNWVNLETKVQTFTGNETTPKYTSFFLEAAGYYRLKKDVHTFDFLGGIRYNAMDLKLDFGDPVLPDETFKQYWVDPIFGVKWMWHFSDKWHSSLRGDIGGFGAGSDFTWNLVGIIYYQPWKHVALFGGYRALYIDYEDGSGSNLFKFDATMHGPLLGFDIRF